MSGPKIIDVVATRQVERGKIAVFCARLEVVLMRHQKLAEQSGLSSAVDMGLAEKIRRAAADQQATVFDLIALRDQVAPQIAFVKTETSRLKETAIENASRSSATVYALDAGIKRAMGRTGDARVRQQLVAAQEAKGINQKARLYEEALELMETQEEGEGNAAIREWLAQFDSGEEGAAAMAELPERHPQRWRLEVERIREEVGLLEGAAVDAVEQIQASLARIEAEIDEEKRVRLLDDLRYPLAEQVRQARESARRVEQVEEWLQALAVHAEYLDLAEWKRRFERGDAVQAVEVEEAIEEANAAAAAAVARREVLTALQSIGYELRSGMETAFVRDGRIVVRKPNDGDYGVELSTLPQGGVNLIRSRVVRLRGQEAQTADERLRDKEREESWCSDRQSIAEYLEALEIKSEVKTARAAGEGGVPVIKPIAAAIDERRTMVRKQRREN
ncbi:MAG: hypothetical protein L3J39_11055 [Verrucomicrobiales bacterium]|nr:hypothetical protein [Verrucomicrobiales bacterium]